MPDQTTLADQDAPPHAPRTDRASVMLMALVEHRDGQAQRHRVRDVAPGGIRIDNAADLRPGEPLSVSVGALHDVAATVRWARAGCAGLAFVERIDPADTRTKGSAPTPATLRAQGAAPAPSAGWIDDLRDAYRR